MIDPAQLPQMVEARWDENYEFRQFLKHHPNLSSKDLDKIVFELEAKAWKRIDCTTCANCCRHVSPALNEEDVARLASHLGVTHDEFIANYLDKADGDPEFSWVMRIKPCPFLKDNRCSVYEHRPGTCHGYPYLNKPDVVSRAIGMIDRTAVCPAAFEV